jgi:hypothetical protein
MKTYVITTGTVFALVFCRTHLARRTPAPSKHGSTKFSDGVANWMPAWSRQYPRTKYSLTPGRNSHNDEFAISSRSPGRIGRRLDAMHRTIPLQRFSFNLVYRMSMGNP